MLSAGMGAAESKSTPFVTSQGLNNHESTGSVDMITDVNEIEIHSDDNFEDTEEAVEGSLDLDDSVVSMRMVAEDTHSYQSEALWEQALNDATEFENILFSIRRPSARHRLEKLAGALKILGSKLKRHEEVTTVLNERSAGAGSWRKRTLSAMLGEDTVTEESKRAHTQAGTNQDGSVDTSKSREPPLLKPKDKFVAHLMDDGDVRCPSFFNHNHCPLGSDCNRVHVFNPLVQPIPITSPDYCPALYTKTDLEKVYLKYRGTMLTSDNFSEKIKPDASMKQRYTSRFTCPVENTLYYTHSIPALGIQSAKSSQGLHWFDSAKDSQVSLCTLIIYSLQQRKVVPETFVSSTASTARNKSSSWTERDTVTRVPQEATVMLPMIHPWNWMEINYEDRCPRFSSFQGCPEGKKCRFAHVHFPQSVRQDRAPTRKALPYAYLHNFGLVLTDTLWNDGSSQWVAPKEARPVSYFRIRYASDDRKRTWYTAAWKCPREGTIYYAAGAKNGLVNSQNMFLYPTLEDAKIAVCGVILNSFADRGLWGSWDEPPSNRMVEGDGGRETSHGSNYTSQLNSQQRSKLSDEAVTERMRRSKPPGDQPTAGVTKRSAADMMSKVNASRQQVNTIGNQNLKTNRAVQNDEDGEILEELFNPVTATKVSMEEIQPKPTSSQQQVNITGYRDSQTKRDVQNDEEGEILEQLLNPHTVGAAKRSAEEKNPKPTSSRVQVFSTENGDSQSIRIIENYNEGEILEELFS